MALFRAARPVLRAIADRTAAGTLVIAGLLSACGAAGTDTTAAGPDTTRTDHTTDAGDTTGITDPGATTTTTTTATTTTSTATRTDLPCARTPSPPSDPEPLALRRAPTEDEPLRVVLYGDSMAITLEPSVEVALADLTAGGVPAGLGPPGAAPGFGFTATLPGFDQGEPIEGFEVFADWRESLERLVAAYDPDLFVVLLGSWDLLDRRVADRVLHPGACGWDGWYSGLVEEAVRRLTANGARAVWLSRPCTNLATDPRRPSLNAAYADAANHHPDAVAYLDFDAFACPDGQVLREARAPDGSLHRVREPDDNHFSWDEAAPVVGPWLAGELRRLLAL